MAHKLEDLELVSVCVRAIADRYGGIVNDDGTPVSEADVFENILSHIPDDKSEQVDKLLAEYESYNCEGWDGTGSEPITPGTLAAARKLLLAIASDHMPCVAPGADGSIGMEWESIILDVGPGVDLNGRVELSGRVRLK